MKPLVDSGSKVTEVAEEVKREQAAAGAVDQHKH